MISSRSRAIVLLIALVFFAWAPRSFAQSEEGLPHIVIILADDLGWNDVGYHGSEIATPNIDRIAREGVELDRFYVQPTCSPTRAALMTGKSPARFGITKPFGKNETTGLPLDQTILPQHLAKLGYQPLMVGKWHLGNYTPDLFPHNRGFEHFYGNLTGGVGYWDHVHGGGYDWQRNGETVREEGYTTHLMAEEAIRVLRERDRARPTFLYLSFGAPHLPNEAPEETVALYAGIEDTNRRLHAGMVHELDLAIGRVISALESEGMLDHTLLFFSSDNGGLVRHEAPEGLLRLSNLAQAIFDRPMPFAGLRFLVSNMEDGGSDNSPLPGGKGETEEGAARVPAVIWWPGPLEPRRHEGFMSMSDVLPTLLAAVDREDAIPKDLDGANQWMALEGKSVSDTPDYLIFGYQGAALYSAPWKLHITEPPKLYDVYADPLETRDLASKHPEVVHALSEKYAAWPIGEREGTSPLGVLLDPDTFGGPEDRPPWADVARERAQTVD